MPFFFQLSEKEEVGADNIFIFGLKAEEVKNLKAQGYHPWGVYHQNPEIRRVLEMIRDGYFSAGHPEQFQPLLQSLLDGGDPYFLLADFQAYIECQKKVSTLYQDPIAWTKKSIHNVAKMGKFSSDRTIQDYANEIWKLEK